MFLEVSIVSASYHGRPTKQASGKSGFIISAFGRAKIILIVGYRSQDIRNYFGKRYKSLQLEYTPESTKGTRLALLTAENFVKGEHFLSMDGDIIIKAAALSSLVSLKRPNILGTMLLSTKQEVAPTHGLAIIKVGRVSKIDYPLRLSAGSNTFRLMDTGFYSKRLFGYLKESNFPTLSEVLKNALQKGEIIEGKIYTNDWFHFMTPKNLKVHINF